MSRIRIATNERGDKLSYIEDDGQPFHLLELLGDSISRRTIDDPPQARKSAVCYRPARKADRRCGACAYRRGKFCELVEGAIEPGSVCLFFTAPNEQPERRAS